MTRLLGIDTATRRLVVGVMVDGVIHGIDDDEGDIRHALRLPEVVARCLSEAGLAASSLDGIVAGVGPGSFVGVRSGMAFAKAMAWSLDLPMVAVGTMENIAEQAFAMQPSAQQTAVLLDARMRRLYYALVSRDDVRRGEVVPVGEQSIDAGVAWLRTLQSARIVLAGDGLLPLGEAGPTGDGAWLARLPELLPDHLSLLRLGAAGYERGHGCPPAALEPRYVRDRVALTQDERLAGESL